MLESEYKFEFEQELEEDRHCYSELVQYRRGSLDGLSGSEIQICLDES
jgi:hypothetical protein